MQLSHWDQIEKLAEPRINIPRPPSSVWHREPSRLSPCVVTGSGKSHHLCASSSLQGWDWSGSEADGKEDPSRLWASQGQVGMVGNPHPSLRAPR